MVSDTATGMTVDGASTVKGSGDNWRAGESGSDVAPGPDFDPVRSHEKLIPNNDTECCGDAHVTLGSVRDLVNDVVVPADISKSFSSKERFDTVLFTVSRPWLDKSIRSSSGVLLIFAVKYSSLAVAVGLGLSNWLVISSPMLSPKFVASLASGSSPQSPCHLKTIGARPMGFSSSSPWYLPDACLLEVAIPADPIGALALSNLRIDGLSPSVSAKIGLSE